MIRILALTFPLFFFNIAHADDLYKFDQWANLAADRKASQPGDLLTVIVFQNAEARNSAQNLSDRRTDYQGNISGGALSETGRLSFRGGFTGRGEVRRSESFITQISVEVQSILPNGNFIISGSQHMLVNGEDTKVLLRGHIRPEDLSSSNQIMSTQIANAQISYDGQGFVSKSAKPGIVNRIFGFLGL